MGTGYGLAKQINHIFQKHQLKLIKLLRLGPRFFIALCQKKNLKCVLKINLYERAINQDCRTHNEHLAREIIFLKLIAQQKNYSLIKKGVPYIYDGDENSERTWYLKSYTAGEFQNLGKSNFLFKESFFTKENLNWLIKFFSQLHQLSMNLPEKKQKLFHHHCLKDYLNLLNDQRIKPPLKNRYPEIFSFFKKHEKNFDKNQTALTHFEPYPVHFIKNKNGLLIIDWENIGWGNSAHDIGVIWVRSFSKPAWQKSLIVKFQKSTPLNKHWFDLFKTEIAVQSLANLSYLKTTTDPDEQKVAPQLSQFLLKQINLIISNKFKDGILY